MRCLLRVGDRWARNDGGMKTNMIKSKPPPLQSQFLHRDSDKKLSGIGLQAPRWEARANLSIKRKKVKKKGEKLYLKIFSS
jgi:hypothetical protein